MGLYISMSSAYKENFVLWESWIEVILLIYIRNIEVAPKLSLVGPLIRHELNASVSHSLQHATLSHLDSCGARTKVMD